MRVASNLPSDLAEVAEQDTRLHWCVLCGRSASIVGVSEWPGLPRIAYGLCSACVACPETVAKTMEGARRELSMRFCQPVGVCQ